jgi:hypothetical protein
VLIQDAETQYEKYAWSQDDGAAQTLTARTKHSTG